MKSKRKRYLFVITFKNGSIRRFYTTTDDPYNKIFDYQKRFKNVNGVQFKQQ